MFCLTCVSSQGSTEKFCRILTIASFMLMRANLMPMQLLGPYPKGRYVQGLILSLFSLLNLVSQLNKNINNETRNAQEQHVCSFQFSLTSLCQNHTGHFRVFNIPVMECLIHYEIWKLIFFL